MPDPRPRDLRARAEAGRPGTHRGGDERWPGKAGIRGEVTELLSAVRRGETGAIDRLVPLVYDELRVAAHRQLAGRRQGQTLDTTDLVHETYLKLVDRSRGDWRDRTHFLAASAVAMRHILVDSARRRAAAKRGGKARRVPLRESMAGVEGCAAEILAVDEALKLLGELDPKLSQIVELRFFGGWSIEEIAELRGVSRRTVLRDWRKARAFLYRALYGDGER
jgi:RNA polymerase sigma factor (TIGR02999 family)